MIEAVAAVAKTAVTEAVKESAQSSAVKEVTSAAKDMSSKGQDLAQDRLSKLESEAKQSCPEDYKTKDVAQDRLSKLEEEAKQSAPEDYEKRDVAQDRLERLEKEAAEEEKVPSQPETSKQDVSKEGIGGSYSEVREHVEAAEAENKEVHHMPADSVSPLERNDGPAIEMDKEDHRQTASCGSSRDAKAYRAEQRAKIENGDFDGAFEMDVDDLHEKFGDKYDRQIEQAREYKDKLKQEGRI